MEKDISMVKKFIASVLSLHYDRILRAVRDRIYMINYRSDILIVFIMITSLSSSLALGNENNGNIYLHDDAFVGAYLKYVKADSNYLTSFSEKSKNELKEAAIDLKPFADNDNPIAMLAYGTGIYMHASKKNASIFKKMIKKSASTGYLPAARKLAQFYRSGKHFGKTSKKALSILEKNALNGHERDLKVLLSFYKRLPEIGENSEKYKKFKHLLDESKNVKNLEKSAHSGDLKSQRIYGHMLYLGKHVKRDYLEATFWLTIALMNPKNNQIAYDSSRVIYARSKLSEEDKLALSERVNKYLKETTGI